MGINMSIKTRKEILLQIKGRYHKATWSDKRKILEEFMAVTNYSRKYAIHILNSNKIVIIRDKNEKLSYKKKYNEDIKQALLTIWYAANQICSKRLVPFIPDLLLVLERVGHLSLPTEVRKKLLEISPATVDRLLDSVRREGKKKGLSTTCAGSLLKKQIKVRTFADWNDVIPGFLEGDLVAHCGDNVGGSFLNTLVLTDIASTWTEFFPLLRKSEADVINALRVVQKVLPFILLGLDTDNGSEFINYGLLNFCQTEKITFTRSRAYKKNDQAHVEEKNGSIIRRLIGYDRYEGIEAYNALTKLYSVLRLYINFFQPSLKLISKTRIDAKVTKKYDKAKTPYQRLMLFESMPEAIKLKLKKEYEELNPIKLLNDLEELQNNFWQYAWKPGAVKALTNDIVNKDEILAKPKAVEVTPSANPELAMQNINPEIRRYRKTKKTRNELKPRAWRTRKDPFEQEWSIIKINLSLNPELTAKDLLQNLTKANGESFNMSHLRTMQRRMANWRTQQININQEKILNENEGTQDDAIKNYVKLVAHSIVSE
jgi:hypothetical protein